MQWSAMKPDAPVTATRSPEGESATRRAYSRDRLLARDPAKCRLGAKGIPLYLRPGLFDEPRWTGGLRDCCGLGKPK